jgi:hypothetical protein
VALNWGLGCLSLFPLSPLFPLFPLFPPFSSFFLFSYLFHPYFCIAVVLGLI